MLRSLAARARELLQRRRIGRELDEEFRFHLETEIAHQIARGLSPDEARRAARIAFGGVERFREETRAARGFAGWEGLARDTRLAVRRLRRAPLFTAGVVATLAVGLGAATGIGTLVHGVLLRPLPYPDPDRLVHIGVHTPGLDIATDEHSAGTFVYLAEDARSFSAVEGYGLNVGVTITDEETPERVTGAYVTPGLLYLLGAVPAAGRLFVEADALVDTTAVIIGHGLWQRRFGGDPTIVGRTIELGRRSRMILGVLGPLDEAPWDQVGVYFPEPVATTNAGLNSRYLTVLARLAPGVTLAAAREEVDRLAARLHERYPEVSAETVRAAGFRMTVERLHDAVVAPVRAELRLLAIMVAALLLIAMANVVTLTLLRAEGARGEVAVARALGATDPVIRRRFILEGVLLALAAAAAALPVAALALAARFGFTEATVPRLHDLAVTPAIVGGLFATALLIGVVVGVIAAARTAGRIALRLRDDRRSTGGRRWRRVQEGLVVAQVAFALALLLGAGLMGASLVRLHRVDHGFAATDRATFALRVLGSGYRTWSEVTGFHTRVEEALRAAPGVTGAAIAMQLPSTPHHLYVHPRLEATRGDGRTAETLVTLNVVSPAFFEVLGIPMRAGRGFTAGDLTAAESGVILSASLARALFGDEDPIGREVRIAAGARWRYPTYHVVGVSGDVFGARVADGVLRTLYLPLLPNLPETVGTPVIPAGVHFVVRSAVPLSQLAPIFRAAVATVDSRVPLWGVRTLDEIVAESTARTRLTMLLLGVAALATLILSAIGLYSVIAYAAAARSREFAVRLALGATPRSVAHLVLREGAIVTLTGVILGGGLSLAGARVIRSVLYEVSATDPRLYLASIVVVVITAGCATLVPAWRAMRVSPATPLRAE